MQLLIRTIKSRIGFLIIHLAVAAVFLLAYKIFNFEALEITYVLLFCVLCISRLIIVSVKKSMIGLYILSCIPAVFFDESFLVLAEVSKQTDQNKIAEWSSMLMLAVLLIGFFGFTIYSFLKK